MLSMKRLLFLVCASLVLVPLAGCGGGDDSAGGNEPEDPTPAQGRVGDVPTPSAAQIEAMTQVQVPGYSSAEATKTLLGGAVTYIAQAKTAGGAELYVRVNVAPCDTFICRKIDVAEYADSEAQRSLKSVLPSAHIENPDLVWEFETIRLSPSADGLATYALSYLETKGSDGSVSRSSVNSFRAWYHNGGTFVTLEVFARSPQSVMSLGDLRARMTRAEAEKAAQEVFAALEPKLSGK